MRARPRPLFAVERPIRQSCTSNPARGSEYDCKMVRTRCRRARTYAIMAGAAEAQTKLKWAHVYETSEPFHTQSVWAAQEISKRTNGRYQIDVYPASQLGKETDINQGLSLGSVDMIISGSSFASRSFRRSA